MAKYDDECGHYIEDISDEYDYSCEEKYDEENSSYEDEDEIFSLSYMQYVMGI